MIAILLSLLTGSGSIMAAETAVTSGGDTAIASTKPALYSSEDPVQKCLDDLRLKKYLKAQELKKKEAEAQKRSKETPTEEASSPYKFDQVSPSELPGECQEGDMEIFKKALANQIANCKKPPSKKFAKPMRLGCRLVDREDYCLKSNMRMLELAEMSGGNFSVLIDKAKAEFDWFKSRGKLDDADKSIPKGKFKFTGYYAPAPIEARLKPEGDFIYPLYKTPPDLVSFREEHNGSCGQDPVTGTNVEICRKLPNGKLVPMYNRREIDSEKKLLGQGLEIAYVKDPVDIAFLMIQGDGSLNVNGKSIRLNYGTENGRPSNLLGNVVTCTGGKAGSMSSIREYLNSDNRRKLFEYLNYDEAYIFWSVGKGGPKGVEDIELSDRHSIATDRTLIRTGSLALFNAPRPKGKDKNAGCGSRMTTLAISQDTGGAIKNVQADWYQGEGNDAAVAADSMHSPGSMFIGVLKGAGTKLDGCEP